MIISINGRLYRNYGIYNFATELTKQREIGYRAGDILIGSDNLYGLLNGYTGHSAIVVDDKMIIEAVMTEPIVRMFPIEDFIADHPIYAHYRPISKDVGERAAFYALSYLKKFEENKKAGIDKPVFNFTINTPLHDEWTYIYCSKLVWLSYYFGAKYEFSNDHLWFAPDDIFTNIKDNPDFELIYIHPDFKFHIDL